MGMAFMDPTPTQPIPVLTLSDVAPEAKPVAPATRTGRPVWPLVVVAVLLVLASVLIVRNLTSGGGGDARVAIPLAGRSTAVIHIDSGADSIVVGTAELGDDLAVVTTPGGDDSGVRPRARMDGDQLRVSTEDVGSADDGARVQIDVRLAAGVRWDVIVDKGAKQVLLALGSGNVNLVELRGGADLADVTLPKPTGTQTLRIPVGLATAAVHVPTAVPAKITFGSGAGRAVVDGAQRQGIAAGITIYGVNGEGGTGGADGYNAAKDRLEVDVQAGVGTLSLDRT